jgi:hypothetical protein
MFAGMLAPRVVLYRCSELVTTNGFLWHVIAGSVVTRPLKTLRNRLRAPACHAGATRADLRGRPAALVTPSEGGDDGPQPPAPRLGIAGQRAAAAARRVGTRMRRSINLTPNRYQALSSESPADGLLLGRSVPT